MAFRFYVSSNPFGKIMRTISLVSKITIFGLLWFGCSGCENNEHAASPQPAPSAPTAGSDSAESGGGTEVAESQANAVQKTADALANYQSDANELPTLDNALDANDTGAEPQEDEEVHTIDIPDNWTRLFPKHEVWADLKKKQVIAGGNICLTAGSLEVFACPRHTKEHESIVSLNALSEQVHAALLAIDAKPGKPVKWVPDYKPASGDVIEIKVMWKADDELITRRGQEMILNIKTGEPMQHDWVFGGSMIEKIEATENTPEESYYLANSGELVCVSNFSTAALDVPVKSSDANEGLLFQANTPNIPEVGTKVYVVFSKKE